MPSRDEILTTLREEKVAYMRLCFTDIMGAIKNVEIPSSQFLKGLNGQILFDGSSIEGFSRIEESDMVLKPDYDTFCVLPWASNSSRVARIICDIQNPDGSAFAGCPRTVLKRVCEEAKKMGYVANMGPEAEFFLFERGENGEPMTRTHDVGGYFDLTPIDRGEETRRTIVEALEKLGFEIEAAHHEVAHAQHEIDFKYDDILSTADKIATFRFVVRKIALDYGLHATFMPKPIYGINGSGMHANQSLSTPDGENVFYDPKGEYELSDTARHYLGGLLKHVSSFCALTNPLVNSYKRLVPGYEAPTEIVWSLRNRSPLIRIPDRRGPGTRVELRNPDPSCNPYLAFAVMLAAGLDGIKHKMDPGAPVNKNIFAMSQRERSRLKIKSLPSDLREAINAMEKSKLLRTTLGDHIFKQYISAKRREWQSYITQVHHWEVNRYLAAY